MPLSDGLRNERLPEDETATLQASVDEMTKRTGSERARAVGIAALYLEKNQNAKAIEVLQRLIDSGHDLVDSYYYLGEVYENANQFDRAEENYKKASRLASEALCAAKAGLARVETELNRKPTRLQDAKAAFDALRQITDDDFVSVRCEEQQGYMVDMLSRLIPGADNEEGERQLLLPGMSGRCGACRPGYAPDIGQCVFCQDLPTL